MQPVLRNKRIENLPGTPIHLTERSWAALVEISMIRLPHSKALIIIGPSCRESQDR